MKLRLESTTNFFSLVDRLFLENMTNCWARGPFLKLLN